MTDTIPTDILLDAWYTVHGEGGYAFPQLVTLHPESLEVRMFRFLNRNVDNDAVNTGMRYYITQLHGQYCVTAHFTSKQILSVQINFLGE